MRLKLYFAPLLTSIILSGLLCSRVSVADDKPEAPHYKPIPTKSERASITDSSTESTAESTTTSKNSAARPTDSRQTQGSLLDNLLDSSGKPLKSLRAHPATSGREPMLLLGPKNRPLVDVVVHTYKLDYFDCQGIVAPWYREVLVAELNYFSELSKIPMVDGVLCLVSIANENHLTPGRISVNFFSSNKEMNSCTTGKFCATYRSVSMILKGRHVYRQYFLSDIGKSLISQNCVTDKGKWFKNSTCYTVED
jgi:hypothetical protein